MKLKKNQNLGANNRLSYNQRYGIVQFLKDYPGMAISPSRNPETVIQGSFLFSAKLDGGISISDSYHILIKISTRFPNLVPTVYELDEKIPRDAEHHVNSDNTLCLGSPLRLKLILSRNPTLLGFADNILVPYLYSISHQRFFGGKLLADELAHGEEGIINEYSILFGLNTSDQIIAALKILGTKKRIANKLPCPCMCGKLYTHCKYQKILEKYRLLANRKWFREYSKNLGGFKGD